MTGLGEVDRRIREGKARWFQKAFVLTNSSDRGTFAIDSDDIGHGKEGGKCGGGRKGKEMGERKFLQKNI